ncbi:MAG: DUF3048 domain-containing protein [Clostridiaceae bacterium]|nr:DUF3048 domain-containing protein [Clostridiaceae bacterium]
MKNVGIKILIIILILLVIVSGILFVMKFMEDKNLQGKIQTGDNEEQNNGTKVVEIKEPTTFKGTDRPIAVMIDNHKSAMPQAGLNDAYMVYEMIVEGGETRLMALFKGVNLDKIGPIRSSRHYFLDYALENDAIYVHFGWSPQAQSDISKLGVNNINGIYESSTSFWRVKDKYAPHNAVTSTTKILEMAKRKGYATTSTKESVLNYVADEIELDSDMEATTVTIPYSTSNTVKYEYDKEKKEYIRYSRNTKQVDWTTKETVTTKNIIIVKCKNTTLNDGENKGRQTLDNVKALEGYYITNGKAIKITAEKSTRASQTVYKDLSGKEINVNDGNTFVQICPLDSKVEIKPGVPEKTEKTNTVQ